MQDFLPLERPSDVFFYTSFRGSFFEPRLHLSFETAHLPVWEQYAILRQKVRGHYAYYGITGNFRMLQGFLNAAQRAWRKWLSRRNRQREMDWDRFQWLLKRYCLPRPRIVHSYVKQRNHEPRSRMV